MDGPGNEGVPAVVLSLCAPPLTHTRTHTCIGRSANTELGKADQLHLIRDLCVIAARYLRGGRRGTHQQIRGGTHLCSGERLVVLSGFGIGQTLRGRLAF